MRAAQFIEQRIADGTYSHGQRLNLGLIAEEAGVYRAAVSRAMTMLEERGLVRRFGGLGWHVV